MPEMTRHKINSLCALDYIGVKKADTFGVEPASDEKKSPLTD